MKLNEKYFAVLRLLLCIMIDLFEQNLDTPLHWASREGRDAVCSLLLSRGANINLRNQVRFKRNSSLFSFFLSPFVLYFSRRFDWLYTNFFFSIQANKTPLDVVGERVPANDPVRSIAVTRTTQLLVAHGGETSGTQTTQNNQDE